MKKYINLDFGGSFKLDERLLKIKNRGFDGVFIFYDEYEKLKMLVDKIRKYKLDIETMHLPFKGINCLWFAGEEGDNFQNTLIDGIIAASRLQIPTVIIHLIGGLERPNPNEIGEKRFSKILQVSEQYKVNLALENVRDTAHNDYMYERFSSPYLKMCFDFGHINCFTKNTYEFDFSKYRNYLYCCHIHDNDSTFDSHQLPFTGNVDYKYLVSKLKQIGYLGPLTSEAINDGSYSETDFIDKVYEALKIIEGYFYE